MIKKGETSQKQAHLRQRSPESNPDRNEVREKTGSLGRLVQHERPPPTLAKVKPNPLSFNQENHAQSTLNSTLMIHMMKNR